MSQISGAGGEREGDRIKRERKKRRSQRKRRSQPTQTRVKDSRGMLGRVPVVELTEREAEHGRKWGAPELGGGQ